MALNEITSRPPSQYYPQPPKGEGARALRLGLFLWWLVSLPICIARKAICWTKVIFSLRVGSNHGLVLIKDDSDLGHEITIVLAIFDTTTTSPRVCAFSYTPCWNISEPF